MRRIRHKEHYSDGAGRFLPCDPAVLALPRRGCAGRSCWLPAAGPGGSSPLAHTDTDGLSSMWARRSAAMSPWASDSAEFPPCRTEEVRHHRPNEPLLRPHTSPPIPLCFTVSHHPKHPFGPHKTQPSRASARPQCPPACLR